MKKSKPGSALPSYGLHKRSGQAYARVLDAGGNRRMIYLGRHGSPESHRLFAELSDAVQDGTLELFLAERAGEPRRSAARRTPAAHDEGPSIKEVVARYLCWAEGYYQRDGLPTTELASMRGAVETLLTLFGDEPASAFHVGKLKLVRQAFVEAGEHRGPKRLIQRDHRRYDTLARFLARKNLGRGRSDDGTHRGSFRLPSCATEVGSAARTRGSRHREEFPRAHDRTKSVAGPATSASARSAGPPNLARR